MALRGSLAGIKLSDIFQMLAMSQQEQTLVVRCDHDKRIFHFTPGSVSVYLSAGDETAMLGEVLVGLGYLSEKDMERALAVRRRNQRRLGEVLLDMGLCEQEQVDEALKLQVESAIYTLLGWDAGSFEVKEGRPDDAEMGEGARVICVSFEPSALLMEAARRMDEWDSIRQFVPSSDTVLCPTAQGGDELAPEASSLLVEKILALVDGGRMVRDIVQASKLPAFDVSAALAELVKQGRARLATTEELFDIFHLHVRSKDTKRALAVCELINRSAEGDEAVLTRLGQCYEKLQHNEEASAALANAGKLLLDAGQLSEAIEALDHAAQLNRSDLQVRERLFSALNEGGKIDRALSLARMLAQAYFKRREYARARETCQFVLAQRPKDEEARFLLIEIHLATGNVQAAAAESNVLTMARPYGEDVRLKTLRSRIDRLDHTPPEHRKQGAPSLQRPPAPARGRRFPIAVVAAVLLLLAAGGGWLWMERAAAQARGDVDLRAQRLLQQQRYNEAIAEYQTLIDSYPYTTTARALKRLVVDLRIRQQKRAPVTRGSSVDDPDKSLATADSGLP